MKNDAFPTQDQYLSAFLLLSGAQIIAHSRTNRSTFWFPNTPELQKLSDQFYSHAASVEPNAFSSALHKVLSVMHGPDYSTPTTTGQLTDVKPAKGNKHS